MSIVTDSIIHWHMLSQGLYVLHAVIAEMPHAASTSDVRAAYLWKPIENVLQHKMLPICIAFTEGSHGKGVSMDFHFGCTPRNSVSMTMK